MRYKIIIVVCCVLLVIAATLMEIWQQQLQSQQDQLPKLGEVPSFQLVDSQGEAFSLQQLQDKVWVAAFFFSTCQGICIPMTENMQSVYRQYRETPEVEIVFITVDPKTDTPETLRKYAQQHNINTDKWHFLTGSKEKIQELCVEGFKLSDYSQDLLDHSDRFALVDSNGTVRGYYQGTDSEEVAKLKQDIAKLY